MFRPGPLEIGLIVFIVLVLFGAGKLPQVGTQIGKGIRAFRRGQSGEDQDEDEEAEEEVEETTPKATTRRRKKAVSRST